MKYNLFIKYNILLYLPTNMAAVRSRATRIAGLHVMSWQPCWLVGIYKRILYLTNRLHFSVRVYCGRSQMTSQRVKNKNYDTRRS